MASINPGKYYAIKEVVEEKLIPGVNSYYTLYSLIRKEKTDLTNKTGKTRKKSFHEETTSKTIKATHKGSPWKKISGKVTILGAEIIKFKKLNSL